MTVGTAGTLLDPALTVPELRRVLDIDDGELAWFADRQERLRRAPDPLQHYRWRLLPKPGGVRVVAAPKPRLKEIQRRLLRRLTAAVPLHDCAHGGVRGRSVTTSLQPHAGARVLVRLDLASFFPTITAGRVRGLLLALGAAPEIAAVLTGLCTAAAPPSVIRSVRDPRLRELLRSAHLPQGAPTSALLANAVTFGLDRRLAALADRFDATYTRYVDDLVFSGAQSTLKFRHRLVDAVGAIVPDEGFGVAWRKTAVRTSAGRLSALGAVVNVHPALPREQRDRLRAIVHNCEVRVASSQGVSRDQLLGHIAAAGALDPRFGARLRSGFDRIDWTD